MEDIVWFCIMIPCSAVFTIIGVYAWRRKKPMWFWTGSTINEADITNIPAYNRANAMMWLFYSLPFWLAALLRLWNALAALIVLCLNCAVGLPLLAAAYRRILAKYHT